MRRYRYRIKTPQNGVPVQLAGEMDANTKIDVIHTLVKEGAVNPSAYDLLEMHDITQDGVRVKLFIARFDGALEDEINRWLERNDVNVIDIKFAHTHNQGYSYSAMIIYNKI